MIHQTRAGLYFHPIQTVGRERQAAGFAEVSTWQKHNL
jgi:hypothetical protein